MSKGNGIGRFFVAVVIILVGLGLAPAGRAGAAPGDLDTSFGGPPHGPAAGKVVTDFGPPYIDAMLGMVVQPDGKIVSGGVSHAGLSNSRFALARYNADASLDSTFSGDGKQAIKIEGGHQGIYDVALRANGQIVAVGRTEISDNRAFAIALYNPNGSLDTNFSGDGQLVLNPSDKDDEAQAVAVQPDGKIIAAGYYHAGAEEHFYVVRVNPNGNLDNSFGGTGVVTVSFGSPSEEANALLVQPDGKIIVAGRSGGDFALARLKPDGTFDGGFGLGGKMKTDFAADDDGIEALALQTDGKIVAGGFAGKAGDRDFAVARYNANGVLDNSFGASGRRTTDFANPIDWAQDMIIQPDGKIVMVGLSGLATDARGAVARYNGDGSLDSAFGSGGRVINDVSTSDDYHTSVVLAGDKIVAGGYAIRPGVLYDFTLVRYNSNGSIDATLDGDGLVATDFGQIADRANRLLRQNDGKLIAIGQSFNTADFDFALARYSANGGLDNSFAGGLVRTHFSGNDAAFDAAFDGGGKLVVVGSTATGLINDLALARYNANGSLDGGFGIGGKVTTDLGGNDVASSVAILADNKILVGGMSSSGGTNRFMLARYTPSGGLDAAFGVGGVVYTQLGSNDAAYRMLLQPDGKILLGGRSLSGASFDFALVRYNADGSLDPTFDGDGKLTTAFGPSSGVRDMALQGGSKLVVAGSTTDGGGRVALARYNLGDGSLDMSFGAGGKVVSHAGAFGVAAWGMDLLADGRIVVAGQREDDWLVALFSPDGVLSSNFGGAAGFATTDFQGTADAAHDVLALPDGGIVAAGMTTNAHGMPDFALARYQPPAAPATGTPASTPTVPPGSTATPTPPACGVSFGDVQSGDYFYQPVLYLACNNVISGYADGTFKPFNNTTRGQLAKIVVGAQGWPIDTTGGPHFSDVPADHTFYQFVETAYNRGVISGYGDGTFRPFNDVTRGQLSKIIVLAEGWPLANPATPTFADVPSGNPFYKEIETAVAHGIVSGYDLPDATKEFRWSKNATRGQIAKIVYLAVTAAQEAKGAVQPADGAVPKK